LYDRVERKVQEQFLAVDIEKQMSKNQILENYMNTINLGQNCLGVQAASKRYFGKDVKDLTLSECAVIAGITQSPTKYNPVTNPDNNAERRKKVLGNMLKQKYITQQEYDEALADNVYERIQTANAAITVDSPYSYFIDALSKDVLNDLQTKLGYSYTQAYNALYSGGLSIYATQDLAMQQICDEELNNPDNYPSATEVAVEYALTVVRGADNSVENYSTEMFANYIRSTRGDDQPLIYSDAGSAQQAIDEFKSTLNIQEGDTIDEKLSLAIQPQASCVVMDQYTGYVKALVGGRGVKEKSLSLNRATDSYRQPGSCFKILSTYAPALDIGKYTLATVVKDEPTTYTNGTPVRNWWGDSYRGDVTVRKAIEQSMNVVTVKVFADITPQLGFNYLKNFGFTTLVENENGYSDIQLPTALGGITKGVINEEMTAAYACIANNGTYIAPILYTKILDHDGNVLLDNTPEQHQVLQDSTAALLTNAMQDVVTKGTGTRAQLSNMPVSGKTGTTSDNKDIWFSGFTP
ncbi:MAG: penicillin-binding transpeptidase domain-containing protein, partial [Lachnospiraceae bacterium]|nr:penicillin-binding transpeptidase domain-containing protein [Lachnospiraceae bacterium]